MISANKLNAQAMGHFLTQAMVFVADSMECSEFTLQVAFSDTNTQTISDFTYLLGADNKSVSIGATFNFPANLKFSSYGIDNTVYQALLNIVYIPE